MKKILVILLLVTCSSACRKINYIPLMNDTAKPRNYHYLALGDSYTIGESVAASENFPTQVAGLMKNDFVNIMPRIIAKTGWTTDELETGIVNANKAEPLRSEYDFVTLLIGVNNQYRERSVESYKPEFEELLNKAVRYAGNRKDRVVVVSIPDWGVTPFAEGRDRQAIAAAIDAYNAVNRSAAEDRGIHYLDITPWTREASSDQSLLTSDGLHPSGKEYRRWARAIEDYFSSKIR